MLTPSGEIQECDLGNGNIMLITRDVVKVIGILSENYTHGIADYDYTLTARREKLPVLLARNYCGNCVDDSNNKYDKFIKLNFKERIKFLYYPTGLAFSDEVKFMKKFYPYRIPMLYFGAIFKLLFPKLYLTLTTKLR